MNYHTKYGFIFINIIILSFFQATICSSSSLMPTDHHPMHHTMHGMYGSYPMTREASGTSWVPDSSQPMGYMTVHHDWQLMVAGFSYVVTDVQRGRRGDSKLFDQNMLMFMGQKDFYKSTFAFRTMLSVEPFTIGKCGYPLLLQTGETCDGCTPLIDRQHPHDLFGELALVGTYRPTDETSFFLYAGLPGEPALGPPLYFMRFSGEFIPEAPITHHWLDSTHISFGVITAGITHARAKFEISGFRGREPNQNRYDIEKPKIDSYALRLSLNPTDNLALQASYGFLKSHAQLEPTMDMYRFTASVLYNKNFESNTIQAAAMVGVNKCIPGSLLPAVLLEATGMFHKKHVAFSRFEWVKKDDLFIHNSMPMNQMMDASMHNSMKMPPAYAVEKLTFGYIYEFLLFHHLLWGIGGLIDFPIVPHQIKPCYGKTTSFMAFLEIRLTD